MSVVSPHFNHYNATNEQSFIQNIVDEALYMKGIEVLYVPRTQDNIDYLFNEDPAQYYNSFVSLAAYPMFVNGFDGQEMMSMFGDEFQKSGSFAISKGKFSQALPNLIRPNEGDLIFMPITNAIMEIKFVEMESPFFEKGKQYVYELKCEAFEYSYENITTGNQEFDNLINSEVNIPNPDTNTEPFGDNSDLETDGNDNTVFDPNNPFGV